MLTRTFDLGVVKRQLLFKKGAVMRVTSSANVETDLDMAELAALQDVSATDLQKIDGITNGTAAANKAVVLGASKEIATITSATITTLTSTTVNSGALTGTTTLTMTSANAAALAVGLAGATNPAFVVDSSTATQAAGLKITGAIAAGTVAVAVISSGADANLTINAKGTGTIGIGSVSTGTVTITPLLQVANISMTGLTGVPDLTLSTNLADALSVKDSVGDFVVFVSTTSAKAINLDKAAALALGAQSNTTGSGFAVSATRAGAVRVFSDNNGANIGDSVRGMQSRFLLTTDQSAGTIRALQGQLKLATLVDVTTGIYTAVQGYNELTDTHIAKTGSTFSCFDASTEIGTSLTIDSGGEYFGVHVETTGSGTITNNGTCAAVGVTKASGAASWPVGFLVTRGSTVLPIGVGTQANTSGSGAILATATPGALRVFTDDNGASIADSVRGVQSRTLLTFDQAGGTIRALQGQLKEADLVDVTTGIYTAVQGYVEMAGTHITKTGATHSCFDASTEITTGMTVDSGGEYYGVHIETTGAGTITNNGVCAGIGITKASGAASWPVGIQIDCDSVVKGIQVGTLGSNITSGVPIANATSINGFYCDDNGADQTTSTVWRNVTARTYFSVDQTAASADYHVLRGHLKAASGVDFTGDASVRSAVNAYTELAGATTVGAGGFLASVFGEIWTDGNLVGTGKIAGVMSRFYSSAGTVSGTTAAFMATKQWASTQNWPYGLYIDSATIDIKLSGGPCIRSGTGDPNGGSSSTIGSIYLRSDNGGSRDTSIYVNTDGGTTWSPMLGAS